MEDELLNIFDQNRNLIGVATRKEVHRLGYWHETFHCWFVSNESGIEYIYMQIRSNNKRDYPNLIDITAAGHLLANESVEDGVREIAEELGFEIEFKELISLGTIKYSVNKNQFIDNEIAHVFLYKSEHKFADYRLQKEEASGIVKAKLSDFSKLWSDEKSEILIEGFEIDHEGRRSFFSKQVNKSAFVPHETSYYESITKGAASNLHA